MTRSPLIDAAGLATRLATPEELAQRIVRGEAPIILDVRTVEEFVAGHIPGAINIPVMELVRSDRAMSKLGSYKHDEIVVYCQVGPRAAFAEYVMMQAGFSGVRDLSGHMERWLRANYPLSRPNP